MTPQLDLRFCSINVFGLKFNPCSHVPAGEGLEIASIACFKLGPSWTIIEFLHGDKPEADNDNVEVVENKKNNDDLENAWKKMALRIRLEASMKNKLFQ